ncbi:MAG: hypothetical protein COB07_03105 [Sulfurovum sp.]|nr:MAG: hypothetical protein COB07_03105 [Sulfurovum sp.]
MAKDEKKLYLELQMDELKGALLEEDENPTPEKKKTNNARNPKNAEIAKLYEDAAEYEEDLKGFEEELEIVNANALKDIAAALTHNFPDEERNYAEELDTILVVGWTHYIEVEKTHPKEQLALIKETDFTDIVEKLSAAYPDHNADFEKDVRGLLVKRWENLVAIKKEHIKQEYDEIKTSGLKPKYAKRVYEQYHGIIK